MAKAEDSSYAFDDTLITYPTRVSNIRAYIFSCLSGDENTNVFTDNQFLAGCSRFSVENPVPTVATRCYWYGNTTDMVDILKNLEKKYGKNKIKIDSK